MKALFYVLNDADLLSPILKQLKNNGINGCTIYDSNGMARQLSTDPGFDTMFGGLRNLLKPGLKATKTLMMVLKDDERIQAAVDAIESVVGDLDLPETGIVFSVNLDYIKGIKL